MDCIVNSNEFLFLIDRINYQETTSRGTVSLNIVWIFGLLTFISLLLVYHNNIRLVDFTQVYDLREQNAGKGGPLMNYITAWAGTFTFPFIVCYGLLARRKVFL